MKTKNGSKLVEKKYLVTFILVTSLFALWDLPMISRIRWLLRSKH